MLQVTTFALFRLMRELDGDMTDEQLANWQPQAQAQQAAAAGSSGGSNDQQQQQELALMTFVRAGAFGKLCQVRFPHWTTKQTKRHLKQTEHFEPLAPLWVALLC